VLVAAAVCPHPPVLVPEVASSAAPELDDLRAACDRAVAEVLKSGADRILVLGTDVEEREYAGPVRGSLAPWGVDLEVALDGAAEAGPALPLSLTVGAWLLGRALEPDRPASIAAHSVPRDLAVDRCGVLGARIASGEHLALLVMGDGTACRGVKAPGYDDPRAEPFDTEVAAALAGADAGRLLALKANLAADLRCAGRAAWQVLAGAVATDGRRWRGELLYNDAPYGVAYFVASWIPV
jgi:hypothetical protein